MGDLWVSLYNRASHLCESCILLANKRNPQSCARTTPIPTAPWRWPTGRTRISKRPQRSTVKPSRWEGRVREVLCESPIRRPIKQSKRSRVRCTVLNLQLASTPICYNQGTTGTTKQIPFELLLHILLNFSELVAQPFFAGPCFIMLNQLSNGFHSFASGFEQFPSNEYVS